MYPSSNAVISIETYLKLRKEYFELMDKVDKLVEKIKELKLKEEKANELIETLYKDLEEKRRLVNQYHIDYGEDIAKKMKKKISNNNDDGSFDIEELLK